jgi:hypothetical protein
VDSYLFKFLGEQNFVMLCVCVTALQDSGQKTEQSDVPLALHMKIPCKHRSEGLASSGKRPRRAGRLLSFLPAS